ncbi:MAG: cytochrome c maturation protein CcmE domain-containing protein, partial [Alcaligenes aquatilis]
MTKRQNRLALILGALVVLGAATALILNAFQSSLVFFFTPTEVSQGQSPENRTFRVGGIVQMDSIRRGGAQGMAV